MFLQGSVASTQENNLKSLRRFGNSRNISLLRACNQWEKAEEALEMLEKYEDVWAEEQKKAWVNAMDSKRDARKIWKMTLSQMDKLTDKERQA